MLRNLVILVFFVVALTGDLTLRGEGESYPDEQGKALVVDPQDDALLEGLDVRRLAAQIPAPTILDIRLAMLNSFLRGTYDEVPPEFQFTASFQLAMEGPPQDAEPVSIRLEAVASQTFGGTTWRYGSWAVAGPLADQDLERAWGGREGWTQITANASAFQNIVTWRLDLSELAALFPAQLDATVSWTLSHPFADSRIRVEPLTEGTLAWAAESPQERITRDRGPDSGYGSAMVIPAVEAASPSAEETMPMPRSTASDPVMDPTKPTPSQAGAARTSDEPSSASRAIPGASGAAMIVVICVAAVLTRSHHAPRKPGAP